MLRYKFKIKKLFTISIYPSNKANLVYLDGIIKKYGKIKSEHSNGLEDERDGD